MYVQRVSCPVIRDEFYQLNGPLLGQLAYRVVREGSNEVALRTNAVLGEN